MPENILKLNVILLFSILIVHYSIFFSIDAYVILFANIPVQKKLALYKAKAFCTVGRDFKDVFDANNVWTQLNSIFNKKYKIFLDYLKGLTMINYNSIGV